MGDAKSRTIRACERKDEEFQTQIDAGLKSKPGEIWKIEEENLVSSTGKKLPRIAGTLSYWFAWDGYLGLKSEYYQAKPPNQPR